MRTVSATEARDQFSELVNRVAYGSERVVVTKSGEPAVAIVPVADLDLLNELEARLDIEEAKKALEEARKLGAKKLEDVLK